MFCRLFLESHNRRSSLQPGGPEPSSHWAIWSVYFLPSFIVRRIWTVTLNNLKCLFPSQICFSHGHLAAARWTPTCTHLFSTSFLLPKFWLPLESTQAHLQLEATLTSFHQLLPYQEISTFQMQAKEWNIVEKGKNTFLMCRKSLGIYKIECWTWSHS